MFVVHEGILPDRKLFQGSKGTRRFGEGFQKWWYFIMRDEWEKSKGTKEEATVRGSARAMAAKAGRGQEKKLGPAVEI